MSKKVITAEIEAKARQLVSTNQYTATALAHELGIKYCTAVAWLRRNNLKVLRWGPRANPKEPKAKATPTGKKGPPKELEGLNPLMADWAKRSLVITEEALAA